MGGLSDAGPQQPENFAALINALNQYEQPDSRPEWVGAHYSRILVKTKNAFLDFAPAERTLVHLMALFANNTFKQAALQQSVRAFQHIQEMYGSLSEGKNIESLTALALDHLFLTLAENSPDCAARTLRQMAVALSIDSLGMGGTVAAEGCGDCVSVFNTAQETIVADGRAMMRIAVLLGNVGWALAERRRLRPQPVAEGVGGSSEPAAGPSVVAESGPAPTHAPASASSPSP